MPGVHVRITCMPIHAVHKFTYRGEQELQVASMRLRRTVSALGWHFMLFASVVLTQPARSGMRWCGAMLREPGNGGPTRPHQLRLSTEPAFPRSHNTIDVHVMTGSLISGLGNVSAGDPTHYP